MKALYVSDLDGTLLNSQKTVIPYTARVLNACIKKGLRQRRHRQIPGRGTGDRRGLTNRRGRAAKDRPPAYPAPFGTKGGFNKCGKKKFLPPWIP